jgi:glycosyl transferase family 25
MIPVFVINLARSTDRRARMQSRLDAIGLAARFVTAVDGRDFTEAQRQAYDRQRAIRVYGSEMTAAEIACCMSHLSVLRIIAAEKPLHALVLEDDVFLQPHLPAIIEDLTAMPEGAWHMVRLTALKGQVMHPKNARDTGEKLVPLRDGALFRLNRHPLGGGAYLVTWQGAEAIIRHALGIFAPWDHMLDRFWENGLPPYLVRPLPVLQDQAGTSEIGTLRGTLAFGQYGLRTAVAKRWQRVCDSLAKRRYLRRIRSSPPASFVQDRGKRDETAQLPPA